MACPPPMPQFVLRGSGAPVNTLLFRCRECDPPLLFSGSGKGAIHVWNLKTRRPQKVLEGHSGASVIWVETLGSRATLISQGRDSRICIWDLREGRSSVLDSITTDSVSFCQCSLLEAQTGQLLLAHPTDTLEEVKVVEVSSRDTICSLKPEGKQGMLMCMKLWQPDDGRGPFLLTGYEDGSLALWDILQRRRLSLLPVHAEPLMCLDFDPAGLRGVSGSPQKAVSSWTLDGQQNLQLQDTIEIVNPGLSSLCIRRDRKILATAGWDNRLRIFGWKKLRPLATLQYHTDAAHCVTFSDHQDGNQVLMAAGSKDERISVWSIYNDG